MRQLHELLWLLDEAAALQEAAPLFEEIAAARRATEQVAEGEPKALQSLNISAHRDEVNGVLRRASELARAPKRGANLRGASLHRSRPARRADSAGRT